MLESWRGEHGITTGPSPKKNDDSSEIKVSKEFIQDRRIMQDSTEHHHENEGEEAGRDNSSPGFP